MPDDINKVVFSSHVIDVFTQNPGLSISIGDALAVRFVDAGCVKLLRYGTKSTDLVYVQFDNATLAIPGALQAFRENFECAAKYGMRVTYCVSTDGKTVSMVNLYPCACKCKD
ncbi:MAG: hypothetical protein R2729_00100 [Bryobacteraceae bacterium]